jgi:ABC-type proline/glycine betaine transport system permease subunit
MWTKAVLVLAFVAVVVPMALLLGVQLGFAWAQHAVLP